MIQRPVARCHHESGSGLGRIAPNSPATQMTKVTRWAGPTGRPRRTGFRCSAVWAAGLVSSAPSVLAILLRGRLDIYSNLGVRVGLIPVVGPLECVGQWWSRPSRQYGVADVAPFQ